MKSTSALFTSFFATVLLVAGPASAAWFLKMDGVNGQSTDMKHKDWIEIQSFSLGTQSHQTLVSASSAAAARTSSGPLTITKTFDKASPVLSLAAGSGKRFANAVIEGTKAGGQVYMRIKLQNIMITSIQMGGSGKGGSGLPTDSMALSYQKIEIDYLDAKPTPAIAPVKPAVAIAPKR